MLGTITLNGFSFELPSLKGLFKLIRGERKVQEEPVRIELVDTVHDSFEGTEGIIHAVHYPE
jgi:hypothetical protein